ncbi:MAG: hypothetical protein NVSMB44_32930 [Ktedonobacteraceae bacterium]
MSSSRDNAWLGLTDLKGVKRMSDRMQMVGKVVTLWRYLIKSMMGEELNATTVTTWGLLGDRAYA